jgi:hypothetical protein
MRKFFFAILICLANSAGFCNIVIFNALRDKDSLLQDKIGSQVKIISFEAIVKGSAITCNWVTALEINNNYFELERSFDGVNFKVTAIAFGAEGSSNANISYQFKDNNEALKRNDFVYYRLKQIGNDSIVQYSRLIKISLSQNAAKELGVVPNPFASNFTYNLNAPSTGYVITKIINLGGRLMATKHTAVTKGNNNLAIDDLNGFSSGVYIMEVMMNGSIIGRQKINKG